MRYRTNRIVHILTGIVLLCAFPDNAMIQASAENQYQLGQTVSTGRNTGYAESSAVTAKDPHYGWELGNFFVTGYTRVSADADDSVLFLKNAGEQLSLCFRLEQDIYKLNQNPVLSVAEDTEGYDELFQIPKQNFGRGALIVRYTNYQNLTDTQVSTDYLPGLETDTNTEILLCEEGDYEIALDYQIKNNPYQVGGFDILPTYTSYSIRFQFSVRNGDTNISLTDAITGDLLSDTPFAENGFCISQENSRYLDIDIQKEVFSEDYSHSETFSSPAREGETYTEEGIYTVTVRNPYTASEPAVKTLYVGSDSLLKAYLISGYSLAELSALQTQGAEFTENGEIIMPTEPETESETEPETASETETIPESELDSELLPDTEITVSSEQEDAVYINTSVTEKTEIRNRLPILLGITAVIILLAVIGVKFLS
ncbi:MAG: hypothetical protein E7496_04095 [Ruminococcus sp.]|nr:hypothetical protein [Ruminococcus sp.]